MVRVVLQNRLPPHRPGILVICSGRGGLTALWYRLGQQAAPAAVPQEASTVRQVPVSGRSKGQGGGGEGQCHMGAGSKGSSF